VVSTHRMSAGAVEQPIGATSTCTSRVKMSRPSSAVAMTIGTKPTSIEVKPMNFLIMDTPRQSTLHLYIKEMRKHAVTDVVRVCEPTYQRAELDAAGIGLHDMEYPDGHSPPKEIIDQWLQLVDRTFFSGGDAPPKKSIAVHCVAGLGRAPVMVALALIEFAGMDPVEAVSLIRRHRRGAINEKQLLYLEGYKKYYRRGGGDGGCCVIS
jgi:protein tyrosine phosphatase type 4A